MADPNDRRFPVLRSHLDRYETREIYGLCPESLPWDAVEPGRGQALKNHYQTLERLAARGGLTPCEIRAVLSGFDLLDLTGDRRSAMLDEAAAVEFVRRLIPPGPAPAR